MLDLSQESKWLSEHLGSTLKLPVEIIFSLYSDIPDYILKKDGIKGYPEKKRVFNPLRVVQSPEGESNYLWKTCVATRNSVSCTTELQIHHRGFSDMLGNERFTCILYG